ncbi:MAG: Gfo/Idh/MocA family protein, partial [Planctomycetota bacterium]
MTEKNESPEGVSRRDFMRRAAGAAAAGIAASGVATGGTGKPRSGADDVSVGVIGTGIQARRLLESMKNVPGVRFTAICDIWEYYRRYFGKKLKRYGHKVKEYEDYRDMLDKEKGLEAVVIATPDWLHSPMTVYCLEAGLHVYCEKEMSNTIEGARKMVQASHETGKLLQIGHQRRSNPRYHHVEKFIKTKKLLGRITHCFGQWNRAQGLKLSWPKKHAMDDAALKRHGYDTMERFRNWRWYRKFSGGPIADLGSHQVDVFSWFLGSNPVAVIASGGVDYYKGNEWYDNVMALYEYDTPLGKARAFYQVLNTTSHGGYYEVFMGDKGSIDISENPQIGTFLQEAHAKKQKWAEEKGAVHLKVGKTPTGTKTSLAALEASAKKPVHMPHLENFFDAIRRGAKL